MRIPEAFRYIHPWAGVAQIMGRPLDPAALIEGVAQFAWRDSLRILSNFAVLLANSDFGSPKIAQFTTDRLRVHWENVVDDETQRILRAIARYFWRNPDHHVAHDEVIYFLQAMVLLYGAEDGPAPSERRVLQWMLAANDHLDLWNSDRDLGDLEMLVAELARITRFNRNVDPLREVCRSIALFGEKPEQVTEERWRQASAKAFGDFQSEIETVFLPLMLLATRWVVGEDAAEEPLVDPGLLYGQTCLSAEERDCARTRLGEMTWSRDEAIKALAPSVRSNGLPTPPVIFFRRPFVALSGARVIATSPRMVREHMMLACWDRLRRSFGGDRWTIAFGVAVEGWCRRVAAMAAASTAFHGTLELSERIGDETEIEDVVVCDGDRVALFSVKSRLMREGLVKTAELGRAAVVRWYEQVLFDAETDTQRQGALRQLDEKVAAIRAGKHEPRIQRDAHVFPVLVTFEDLGDNVALGAWMHERCTQLGVLRGDRIAPPTLATVAHFETIMALAADGTSIFSLIGQSDVKSGRYRQLQSVLHEVRPGAPKRLPQIQSMFDAITNAMVRRLFGRDATDAELAAPDSGSM